MCGKSIQFIHVECIPGGIKALVVVVQRGRAPGALLSVFHLERENLKSDVAIKPKLKLYIIFKADWKGMYRKQG